MNEQDRLRISLSIMDSTKRGDIVIVESAFRDRDPEIQKANRERAERVCGILARCGRVPWASHCYATHFLPETPEGRAIGLAIGERLAGSARVALVVGDGGAFSSGVLNAVAHHEIVRSRTVAILSTRELMEWAEGKYVSPKLKGD